MRYLSGIILITLLIPALAEKLHAQTYKFRQYGIEEGICHPFVYTVNQDKNGFIWLGTGEGLCKFDGFDFYGDFTTDSLPEAFVKKIYKDREGNLWLGHNDGNITFYDGQHFSIIEPDEKITSTINDITGDTLGNILFATQNQGVIRVNKRLETKNIKIPFQQKLLSSICFTPEGLLLVGAYDGLYLYEFDAENDTALLLSKVSQLPYTMVSAIEPAGFKNGYLIGTQDEGLYSLVLDENNRAEVFKLETESALKYTSVVDISRDSHNNVWLSTQGEGVYKITLANDGQQILSLTHFNDKNGLGSIFIRDVFEDLEGNIWICTYGNGLATLFDEAFVFYQYKDEMGSDIYSVEADDDGFWIGGAGKILKVSKEVELKTEIYGNSTGVPADNITALHLDGDNNLWIGTADKGLYRMDLRSEKVSKIYTSENSLENIINAIDGDENTLWVATNSGVVAIDKKTGQRRSYTTSDGLPHNKISDIFVDSKGNVWIATRSNGLFSVNQKIEYRISGNVVLEFIAITEDDNGNLWAATNNDGVFKFLADTPQHYSTYNGLKSAACYSIINDNHGNIWVGHRLGLSKINVGNAVVLTYGTETGISGDCYPNSVSLTSDGTVLFGTSDGLVTFNTRKERKNIHAPFLNITSLKISDRDYSIDKPIILPYGIYKVRVDFIGLNFRASDRVTYQYKLDGYDDWSEPSNIQYAQYSRIEDGSYTFMLRACNSEGICNETPLQFSLRVKLPIWKTWWFITIVSVIAIFTVYIIIKLRERKQKQFQEILQKKLDERTREVVMQKEEIEVKNKDITDSINYAQRIQASILPPISKLQETFSGSFVFYQPRDIVSGDFYWYDRFENDKFIIVCADSTGHGVPGAFMSMIGTTLIKDICSRRAVESPNLLLRTLDKEIMAALNQNIEAERSNDGMDIIVAEFDLKKHKLSVASAMRPMIIYQEGEQIYVRGSRSSVGGQYEVDEKDFEATEFQLSRGDKVYMFSDGYPDQFGGPLGKKFKMVRLKNMLRDIHEKPMDEQYNYIKNNFEIWKEDLEQVDDVLFMGIEL